MNQTLKTVLLTVLTLSVFTIAIIEISGLSTTAIINPSQDEHAHFVNEATEVFEGEKEDLPLTTMHFAVDHHDFGILKEGEVGKHSFTFTNTGNAPLLIEQVIPSCGCTVPNYPTAPIAPGQQGVIDFEFNSQGRVGDNARKITVIANIEAESRVLTFNAVVEP